MRVRGLPYPVMGMGSPLSLARAKGGGFSLASLFRAGEDGFLFYPMSDLTRLFLVNAGSTGNAAADNDPVGLDFDNHGWGSSSFAAILAAQTELLPTPSPPGTGSAYPSGWGFSGPGLTGTVVGSGTDGNGLRYFDIRIAGTPTNTYAIVYSAGVGAIPCAKGDTDRYDCYVALVGGTLSNVGSVSHGCQYSDSGSVFLGSVNTGDYKASLTSSLQLRTVYGTSSWDNTASDQPRVLLGVTAGQAIDVTLRLGPASLKRVPGRHALQTTTTKRPLYKTNSGKPYLQPDGSDDGLVSPFIPTGNLTMAIAARLTKGAASTIMLGGGNSTGNVRAYIGIGADGVVLVGWGTSVFETSGPDRSGADMVVVVTGDGTGRDLWINGVQATIAAPSGAPNGSGGGMALGQFNNNGTPSSFASGNLYAALALNRRVTPAEIAGITSLFKRTYQ